MEFPDVSPAVVMWIAILLLVFITSFFGYLNKRNKYRLLETLAEKGQALSPEMLAGITNGHGKSSSITNPIPSGIFLMCVGIALAVFFWAMQGGGIPLANDNWLAVIGIFPFMIGLARVLGYIFDRPPSK